MLEDGRSGFRSVCIGRKAGCLEHGGPFYIRLRVREVTSEE